MRISDFGASDISNGLITNNTTPTSRSSAGSSASSASGAGVFIDPLDAIAVVDETKNSKESLSASRLLSELTKDINNDNLADVRDVIDTYTNSLNSATAGDSANSTPPANFLADLKALKSDALSNNLSAAVADLAKAKADAPRLPGPYATSANPQTLSLLNSLYPGNGTSSAAAATSDGELTGAGALSAHA